MSRIVELSDDEYREIERKASASGITPRAWIVAQAQTTLDREPVGTAGDPQRTLVDLMDGLIGVIDTGEADLSTRAGELFAEGLGEKHTAGRL